MFADTFHSSHASLSDRLASQFEHLVRALVPAKAPPLPRELHRLPDHLLRDIGVDRSALQPESAAFITPPDVLHSRYLMAEFLATTSR